MFTEVYLPTCGRVLDAAAAVRRGECGWAGSCRSDGARAEAQRLFALIVNCGLAGCAPPQPPTPAGRQPVLLLADQTVRRWDRLLIRPVPAGPGTAQEQAWPARTRLGPVPISP